MKHRLAITLLVTALGLAGCAASLVYDRDRSPAQCDERQQNCQHFGAARAAGQLAVADRPQVGLSRIAR